MVTLEASILPALEVVSLAASSARRSSRIAFALSVSFGRIINGVTYAERCTHHLIMDSNPRRRDVKISQKGSARRALIRGGRAAPRGRGRRGPLELRRCNKFNKAGINV